MSHSRKTTGLIRTSRPLRTMLLGWKIPQAPVSGTYRYGAAAISPLAPGGCVKVAPPSADRAKVIALYQQRRYTPVAQCPGCELP